MLPLRAALCVGLITFSPPARAADVFSTDWVGGLKSKARLILGDASDGLFHVGVEIKLAPGAITYWRNPGDAGVPPILSFDGSENLADARPSFPAPLRLEEGAGEAFGYEHSLVLPLDVAPADPAKPVTLALKLDYAVCEKICVPERADLRLPLGKESGPSPYTDVIAAAKAMVPRPIAWSSLSGKATLVSSGDKAWRLCLDAQPGPAPDLFIEAPEQWWFIVARDLAANAGQNCFRVKLDQKPDDQGLPVTARLTFTGGSGPFETTVAFGEPVGQ
jgi:DsbC/DsbD-like thiol-disulfide interchange protein